MNATNIAYAPNIRTNELIAPMPNTQYPNFPIKYEPFTDPNHLAIVVHALMKIDQTVMKDEKVLRRCNAYFETLSGSKYRFTSFATIWNDPQILICFWPGTTGHYMEAVNFKKFITLSERLFTAADPITRTAGTLVHEMAHIAGAGIATTKAEASLEYCGFDAVRVKGLVG